MSVVAGRSDLHLRALIKYAEYLAILTGGGVVSVTLDRVAFFKLANELRSRVLYSSDDDGRMGLEIAGPVGPIRVYQAKRDE